MKIILKLLLFYSAQLSINLAQNDEDILKSKLRQIGVWLRDHKFNEIDQRYASVSQSAAETRYFRLRFPTPNLKYMVTSVENACLYDARTCVHQIHAVYMTTAWGKLESHDASYTEKLQKRHDNFREVAEQEIRYEGFSSRIELFQYRATASYYLCHFTLQRDKDLAYFGHKCNINEMSIEFTKSYPVLVKGTPSKDYRALDDEQFKCAFLSFCPDVCCGKVASKNL